MRKLILILFAASFTLGQEPETQLPTDEAGLFSYAQQRANRRDWREADRVFQLCLEKFPDGKHAENAHFQLGVLHVRYSREHDAGRAWLEKLCERFPKSGRFWEARFLIAESYANDKDKQAAIKELRHIAESAPDEYMRTRAAQRILNIEGRYLRLYVNQTFTEGRPSHVQLGTRNLDSVEFTLYRIGMEDVLEHFDAKQPSLPLAASKVPLAQREKRKTWTQEVGSRPDRYEHKRVEIPTNERGFYLVEARARGVTMTVAYPVNRYGVIVKTAGDKSLVFAQERESGEPVADMVVRVLEHDRRREFRTDAQGMLLLGDVRPGAQLIGVKEGDYVFATAQNYGWAGTESRYYITTDRPIYRPNQTVHFKIVHRTEDGATLALQKDLRIAVKIVDTKNNEVYKGEHRVDDFGTCSGSFVLGDEPALGQYRIEVDPLVAAAPVQDWRGRYGNFRVDEYRKPEFKVGVSFDKPHYVQGDTLKATISADYYFGSPVPNAKVSYTVRRASHWWSPGLKYRSVWYDWYAEELWAPRHYGETVITGTGVTDENGRLAVAVPLARWEHDAQYSIVAGVTDLSRRQINGSGAVRVNRAEFNLAVTADRYVYRAGDTIRAAIKALYLDGKPVIGQKLRIVANQRYWRHDEYEERQEFESVVRTDQNGEVTVAIKADKPGYYAIRVSGTDARGNETDTYRWAWVASEGWDAGHIRWDSLDIVPDKASYQPGELATFLISSEQKDATVLFTLESTRIHHQQVVKLNGNTATVRVKLDDASLIPNVWAQVTTLRGSVMHQRQRGIMVDPARRFLDVEIKTDQGKYRPRDPAAIEVTARDSSGQPVAAEFSLGIVDESIYALQREYAEDIRQFFLRKRYNRVVTVSSLQYWQSGVGGLEDKDEGGADFEAPASEAAAKKGKLGRAARGLAAGDDSDDAYAETEVRTNFADTMFWQAHVVTDADGRATVRIPQVADNLTTWRLTARAMTKDGRMGQGTQSMLVRKDVIVRLHAPRFFTQGDVTTLSAVVHNYLDSAKKVKVVLTAEGLDLKGQTEQFLEIGAQEESRIDWPVTVRTTGVAKIAVRALTDEESDAMELTVPMLPHGSLAWSSSTHLVKGALDTSVTIPEDAIPEATELHVNVSPTHAATVLDALDYLADYPYGCVEQTMSRFLPSVITRQVLRKLNLSRPQLEKELPDMINQGLQRLYNFQNGDGGWGWWKNDGSNPFTTAYVVYGLAQAQAADVAVSGNALRRGIQSLQRLLSRAEDDEERAYLLYALSAAGRSDKAVRNALADNLTKLTAVHKAMLAMVLHKDGERAESLRVLKSLEADAQARGATVHFTGPEHYRWTGHNVETTALALKALLAIDADNEMVPGIVTWLSMQREGHYWVSTRQTAMVVYAMADYLARTGELEPDLTLTLTVNGKQQYSRRVTKENWRRFHGRVRIDPKLLRTGKNEIRLVSEGKGTPVCSIYLKHFKKADTFKASEGALQIQRRYERVTWSGNERHLTPLDSDSRIKSGDEVQVTLKVTADREYRYLMLEDPMPAGFEAVREQRAHWGRWTWWYSHKEFRDEKVEIAITYLPEGEREVTYVMRAETPGTFKVLPSLCWNMYRPGEGANSAGRTITVED